MFSFIYVLCINIYYTKFLRRMYEYDAFPSNSCNSYGFRPLVLLPLSVHSCIMIGTKGRMQDFIQKLVLTLDLTLCRESQLPCGREQRELKTPPSYICPCVWQRRGGGSNSPPPVNAPVVKNLRKPQV